MNRWVKIRWLLLVFGLVCAGVWGVYALYKKLSDIPSLNPFGNGTAQGTPKQRRYVQGHEEVITFFARENGDSQKMIARKAFLLRRPGAELTVFLFHGFMCNKHDIRFLANALFSEPIDGKICNTVVIDFRAHGDIPEGQCCTFGRDEMYDVMGIVNYIKADPVLKNTTRIAYGFSMGAVASILAQAHDPSLFSMAIWDCPFDSSQNLLGRALEKLSISLFGYEVPVPGRSLLHSYAYHPMVQSWLKVALKTIAKMDVRQIDTCIVPIDTVEAMSKISIPVMIIGCRNDDKAPTEAVAAVYNAARGYKRLWVTNGRLHFDSYFYNPEKYTYKVRRFVTKVLDGTIKKRPQAYISEDEPEKVL